MDKALASYEQFLDVWDLLWSLAAAGTANRLFGLGWDLGGLIAGFLSAWLLKPVILAGLYALALNSSDKESALAYLIAIPAVSGVATQTALALIGCLTWTSLRRY